MDNIMICKELSWNENVNNEVYYIVPEEWGGNIKEGNFIYIICKETENQAVSIAQIIKLDVSTNITHQFNITTLSENEKIHLVSEEYFIVPIKKVVKKHYNDSVKELRKFLNILIKDLEREIYLFRVGSLNDKRKEYLLKLFYDEKIEEFYKKSEKYKIRWFKVFGNFELDFVHMINLYKLKETISQLIEMNKTISDKDKVALKNEYFNKLEMTTSSIGLKGINRYKLDDEIGIDISSDGKNIIFGKLSPLEFNLNFFSFWNIVKSLLTVSFIPILVVLLDFDKKIIIYCLLGIVYLITLILSDEKQADSIIDFMNQIGWNKNKRSSYGELFYIGVIAVLVFVIFSVQVVYIPNIVDSIKSFALYLTGDFLLAITSLFVVLALVELFIYLITSISSTIFYIKRAKRFSAIFLFCSKVVFWVLSDFCIYNLLGIEKYNNKQTLEWELIVFAVATMITFLKIFQSTSEFKDKIKNNYVKTSIK